MRYHVLAAVILGAAIGAVVPVSGGAHEVRTVSWFVAHPDTMRVILNMCHENPGQLYRSPNCVNAEQAKGTVYGDNWMVLFGQHPGSKP
jgi:hypothetical protein